jgi:RNA polymerase sigma factor (sigma-70 family)
METSGDAQGYTQVAAAVADLTPAGGSHCHTGTAPPAHAGAVDALRAANAAKRFSWRRMDPAWRRARSRVTPAAAMDTGECMPGDASMSAGPSPAERAREALDAELPRLRAFLRHLLPPSDADDVAQDVCLEVLANPAVLLRGDAPGAYLRGIARHLASRQRRRYPRHQAVEELIALAYEQAEPLEVERERAALKACLAGISVRLQEMLDLRYHDGLNASQIGQRLGLSAEGVRMALMRGRQALARCLAARLGLAQGEMP